MKQKKRYTLTFFVAASKGPTKAQEKVSPIVIETKKDKNTVANNLIEVNSTTKLSEAEEKRRKHNTCVFYFLKDFAQWKLNTNSKPNHTSVVNELKNKQQATKDATEYINKFNKLYKNSAKIREYFHIYKQNYYKLKNSDKNFGKEKLHLQKTFEKQKFYEIPERTVQEKKVACCENKEGNVTQNLEKLVNNAAQNIAN